MSWLREIVCEEYFFKYNFISQETTQSSFICQTRKDNSIKFNCLTETKLNTTNYIHKHTIHTLITLHDILIRQKIFISYINIQYNKKV